MKKGERRTRLRYSEQIADLCDFYYDTKMLKYGGFFSVYQCEQILRKIEELERTVKELNHEKEIIERERNSSTG